MRGDTYLLTEVLGLAGMLILENGGDTHRAEETAERICAAAGRPGSDVLALPTGIMITISPYCGVNSLSDDGTARSDASQDAGQEESDAPTAGDASVGRSADHPPITCSAEAGTGGETAAPVSLIRRVKKRTINLSKLERVNRAARNFTDGKTTLDETLRKLREIDATPKGNRFVGAVYSGISSGLFAMLFGGGWFEFAVSFICGFVVQLIATTFKRSSIFHFAISLIGGVIIAALAVTAAALTGMGNVNLIIIGSLMTLLPGLAMTNAIRDAMTGDLVSGVARLADVLLISLSLAGGVGIVLSLYISFGGTVR